MDIERINEICQKGSVKWTKHCLERMQERSILIEDVKNCITKGEIIEEYPDDFPNPSALIYGKTVNENVIHVVCGMNSDTVFVITAYYPNEETFEADLKTRRD